jgi:dTDP-4-dehydrorhamnose reductase
MKEERNKAKPRILIFGGSGMLGNAVIAHSSERFGEFQFTTTYRSQEPTKKSSNVNYLYLDVDDLDAILLEKSLRDADIVINCIGLIWQKANRYMSEKDFFRVNYEFPLKIQDYQFKFGFKNIHIGTDCVFNGNSPVPHTEIDALDATDLYGRSKAKAEIELRNTMILRSSIIGQSPGAKVSLLDWFLSRERGSQVKGYSNHYWNGIGTVQLARILSSFILRPETIFEGVQHLVPADCVTKFELLSIVGEVYNRKDIVIDEYLQETEVNHLLATINPTRNIEIWRMAGYSSVPKIHDIVEELKFFYSKDKKFD